MIKRWTKDETDLLVAWIEEHPDEKVQADYKHLELTELLPKRKQRSIFDKWRKLMIAAGKYTPSRRNNPVVKNKTHAIDLNEIFGAAISEYIANEISKHIDLPRITKLEQENKDLKTLLRKLTKVREAVEEFKL